MYCNWTCDHCWSKFGWKTLPSEYELDSTEVVKRLVRGLQRNNVTQARMSGGESSLYWDDHTRHVARKFIEETSDLRIRRDGEFRRHHPVLVIETNGSMLTPEHLAELEQDVEEPGRLHISVGMKATDPTMLSRLTGHTPDTARRFHESQLALVDYLADSQLVFGIVLLDRYTTEEGVDALYDRIERLRPGGSDVIDLNPLTTRGWGSQKTTHKHFTPKRHRDRDG